MTERQEDVLDYILTCYSGEGYLPSNRDICDEFGWSSPNAAFGHIKALQRKGWLLCRPNQGYALTKEALANSN